MAEWIPTNDGRPLKTTDWMLDEGSALIAENVQLRTENVQLREELLAAMDAALVG